MKKAFIAIALCALFAFPVIAEESSLADFKEWTKLLQGRWVGNVEWFTDLPGLGNRGEETTGYFECQVVQDGHALVTRFYGGTGSDIGLAYYDAAARRIRWTTVDSGGTVANIILFKDEDTWTQKISGSLMNTGEIDQIARLTIEDDGNTFIWTWSEGTVDGNPSGSVQESWTRLGN